MEFLLAIGCAMFAGLFLSRLTSRWNLPDVTSYLIAGLLVGPLVLGRLKVPGLGFESFEMVEALGLLTDTALGNGKWRCRCIQRSGWASGSLLPCQPARANRLRRSFRR